MYGPGYVDELVAQIADDGQTGPQTYWYLQDANYNVVAVLGAAGEVLLQYGYEPYGVVVAADDRTGAGVTPPTNRAGHQGLFFERIYLTGIMTIHPALAPAQPAGPAVIGLYYNRNRWYSPDLGRFTTPDPNASATPIIVALAMNAQALDNFLNAFDPQSHFADGMNLYGYQGSNPVNGLDGLGLSWGYDDEIDDLIADQEGHRLYALGALNEGAKWAALGLQTSLGIAGALLGVDVFESVFLLASGQGGFWEGMDIVLSANPLGRVAKLVGKGYKWARRATRAGKVVGEFADWLRKGARNVSVYIGYRNGKAVYVGISNDVIRRAGQHGRAGRGFDDIQEIGGALARNEARSVEQVIKECNPHFENKINSISPSSEFYRDAVGWAEEWLGERGLSGYYP